MTAEQWQLFFHLWKDTPIPLLTVLIVMGLCIWRAVGWGYSRQVTNLQEQNRTHEARRQFAEDQAKIAGEKGEKAEQQIEKLKSTSADGDWLKVVEAIKSVQVYLKEAAQANNAVQASLSSSYSRQTVNRLLQGGETIEPVFVPEGEVKKQ